MCDRLCPLKASIRRYCNEGNDVVSAKNMHTVLKERPVRGMTASVCIVQEQNSPLEINKIAISIAYTTLSLHKRVCACGECIILELGRIKL